jgi:hypothetical protein
MPRRPKSRIDAPDGGEMLVLRFNPQRRRRPPKVPVPQDALPRVDVNRSGQQSIRAQLRHAREQQQIQAWYPTRQAKAPTRLP